MGILMTAVVVLLTSAIASPYAQDISPQVMTTNHFLPQNKKQESPTDITKEPLEAPMSPETPSEVPETLPEVSEEQVSPPTVPPPPFKVPPGARRGERPFGAIVRGQKSVTCNDTEVLEKFITETYQEIPFTIGMVKNKMGVVTNVFMLYVHPKTKAFSFVEHAATGMSCILAEGLDLNFLNDPNIIMPAPNFKEQQMVEPQPQFEYPSWPVPPTTSPSIHIMATDTDPSK